MVVHAPPWKPKHPPTHLTIMKLTAAVAFFAIAAAGVDATKPAMHGGRLTLQDLLALRNGAILPEMGEWLV